MHMALDWTLRPDKRESRLHRLIIFFERLRKAAQFRDSLLINLFQPCIKAFPLALSQHGRKFQNQFIGLLDLLIPLAQLGQILLLPFQTLIFFKGNPMSYL